MDDGTMVSADEARAHAAEMAKSLADARMDYARLLGDYQELVARLVLTIEAGATTADAEATRLMVADHAAGRGIDGCCVETARRIADAIRATDTADARARRIAAQRTAERERDEAVAMLRNLLARVHQDGGQHSDAVGLAQATEEADEIIARDFAELARLRAPRPSAIVLRPVDPMPLRGLPCACDEWGTGHLDGCPNGDESTDGRDA